MSHFSVAVLIEKDRDLLKDIDQIVDKMMRPYHEYESDGILDEYVKKVDRTENLFDNVFYYMKDCSKEYHSIIQCLEDGNVCTPEEEKNMENGVNYVVRLKEGTPDINIDDKEASLKSFKEYFRAYAYTNPNYLWDYYGSARYIPLKIKDDAGKVVFTDSAIISDIDFYGENVDDKAKKEYEEIWNAVVNGKNDLGRSPSMLYNLMTGGKEKLLKQYKTKDNYVQEKLKFITYALLDKDGWHAPGRVGWFGMDDATDETEDGFKEFFYQRMVCANPDDILVTLDCHI